MFPSHVESIPGPGQYETQKAFERTVKQDPEWSFPDSDPFDPKEYISREDVNKVIVPPGPGEYKNVLPKSNAKLSIICASERPQSNWGTGNVSAFPGPNEYDTSAPLKSTGGIKYVKAFQTSSNAAKAEVLPGPGEYFTEEKEKYQCKKKKRTNKRQDPNRVNRWVKSVLQD